MNTIAATIKNIFITIGLVCLLIYALPLIAAICAIEAYTRHQQAKAGLEQWPSEM